MGTSKSSLEIETRMCGGGKAVEISCSIFKPIVIGLDIKAAEEGFLSGELNTNMVHQAVVNNLNKTTVKEELENLVSRELFG